MAELIAEPRLSSPTRTPVFRVDLPPHTMTPPPHHVVVMTAEHQRVKPVLMRWVHSFSCHVRRSGLNPASTRRTRPLRRHRDPRQQAERMTDDEQQIHSRTDESWFSQRRIRVQVCPVTQPQARCHEAPLLSPSNPASWLIYITVCLKTHDLLNSVYLTNS